MTRVLAIRGTSEPYGHNMIMGALGGMDDVHEITYPGSIFPLGRETIGQSESAARAALRVEAQRGPWIGVGYSLGAYSLGDAIAYDHLPNCVGIVQIADPLRHRDQVTNGGVSRSNWGIAGERRITGLPVYSFAIPDDPIASCPGDNGLRLVANAVTRRMQPLPPRCFYDTVWTMQWLTRYPGRHVAYGADRMPGSTQTYMQAARAAVVALRG